MLSRLTPATVGTFVAGCKDVSLAVYTDPDLQRL